MFDGVLKHAETLQEKMKGNEKLGVEVDKLLDDSHKAIHQLHAAYASSTEPHVREQLLHAGIALEQAHEDFCLEAGGVLADDPIRQMLRAILHAVN